MVNKLNIAILGSGNIGTDLFVKVQRSPYLNCSLFVGRTLTSPGMRKAASLGAPVSDKSIEAIVQDPDRCDLVFDATSAAAHHHHAPVLRELGKKVIDLTPSQIGKICVPAINLHDCKDADSANVNMITCGGQASIPIAYAITQAQPDVEYVEVISSIASRSAGPGTRVNLDEYIENTEKGLRELAGSPNSKAILILNPAQPCINMQTTIFAKVADPDLQALRESIGNMAATIAEYVPGYQVLVEPTYENGRVVVMVRVEGLGDYLPTYAGNLDIITCAAIATAEEYAKTRNAVTHDDEDIHEQTNTNQ